ncbi:uncharacterized protein LOC110042796 [Orbicella faveolata]|uniref:uncharacterized protein LOC110042795 n=1 Tax=Orbicella faveolata TaxID=48498 RepID=UPI0009E2A3BA|nr:uncharacterized protein LOC110042795 [Orbicella faveolata]XP_020603822.1 uncharacterized protein LOC110042796 [Orbicella faveolata]
MFLFKMTSDMCSVAVRYEEQKLALESELSDYKLSVNDCKLSLEEAETNLKNTKKNNKLIVKRLKTFKARCNRRGKIIKADKETKVEMKEKVETLQKENEKLRSELNNGFIGRYRQMKRFFLRVAEVLLFRTTY